MFYKALKLSTFLALTSISNADIIWPQYSQQCDVTGPHFVDDEQTCGTQEKYHDGSTAYPQLLEDGSCAKPLQGSCASRDSKKTAYLKDQLIAEETDGIVESMTKKKTDG